ncbi:hypothetical protein BA059_15245 [Mycolicibacterium sp. (ex Dasyatis americana)]|nr:hypothetical protein BA059_15245 [Mycolicibacterium sp. (ex Dasyatis americana)]
MVLSLDDVRQISGFDQFDRNFESDKPTTDDNAVPACRPLTDQGVAFGDRWTEFRAVSDDGDLDVGGQLDLMAVAGQVVAVYPNEAAARAVFDQRIAAVEECVKLQIPYYDPVISNPDANTAVFHADGWSSATIVKSTVVVEASVVALPEAERVASEMARTMADQVS